jgi:adenylate cyclase class 2
MPVETEIKLRLPQGPQRARVLLEQHGFRATGPRQLETNQLFDLPAGQLRESGRLLRLRSAGGRWSLTYKGPRLGGSHKRREELEAELSDGSTLAQILAALGYQPSFAYEKFRTTFEASGQQGIVTLDETPIGDFLELEGPESWIDQTAARLGFGPADYVTSSYGGLYEEYRRIHETDPGSVPCDMKFHLP